jgi:hypothetical protein
MLKKRFLKKLLAAYRNLQGIACTVLRRAGNSFHKSLFYNNKIIFANDIQIQNSIITVDLILFT